MALVVVTLALSTNLSRDALPMNLNLALVAYVRLVPEPLPRDNIKPRSQVFKSPPPGRTRSVCWREFGF